MILEKAGRGRHRKYLPHAFTEQGGAMLSSVLRWSRDGRRAYADRRPLDAPLLPLGTRAAGCDTPHTIA